MPYQLAKSIPSRSIPGDPSGPSPTKSRRQDLSHFRGRAWQWFLGITQAPVTPEPQLLEKPEEGKIGICCSGGGIRSAAFNLGALQELRKAGILTRASIITAVSGGSYIASAYAIATKLSETKQGGPIYSEGSPEERFLRNHTSYLASGLMGKLRLGLRIFFGIVWNLTFVALTLYVIAVPLGWFYRSVQLESEAIRPWVLGITIAPFLVAAAFGSIGRLFRLDEGPNRFLEVWSTRLLLVTAGSFALLLLFPAALSALGDIVRSLPVAGTLGRELNSLAQEAPGSTRGSGLISLLYLPTIGGLTLGALRALLRRYGEELGEISSKPLVQRVIARLKRPLLNLGAAIVGPLLVLVPFTFFAYDARARGFPGWSDLFDSGTLIWGLLPEPNDAGLWLIWVGIFTLLYGFADLTQWSLHPFYRRQLSSVFATRRVPGPVSCGPQAKELPYNSWSILSESQPDDFPQLVICAAANISNEGATPTGTDVTSFTFSSKWIGGPLVGWIPTSEFEQSLGGRKRDITLRAAVAMSGAAISPSMGRMTKRSLRFLMGLANLRLGVWIPSPRATYRWQIRNGLPTKDGKLLAPEEGEDPRTVSQQLKKKPRRILKPVPIRPRPHYLFKELLGINRLDDKFLYVTDGGHFENLGLVELLRRGCTEVWCIDASGDSGPGFGTLGQAVGTARSDLEVEISIDPEEIAPNEEGISARGHVVGRFAFKQGTTSRQAPEGKLVFIKASVTDDMPADVKAFRLKDRRFPNHPTSHQLFNSDEFEAYRALGGWLTRKACRGERRAANKRSE